MENPKCPYCMRVMARRLHNGLWSYKCPECGASSPECETREEAYAAAMERDRVKGEWVEYPESLGISEAYSDDQICCSECKAIFNILENDTERFNFCPNCGADMRKEEDDERRV